MDVTVGRLSTLVRGDEPAVFAALRAAFRAAGSSGSTVMVATLAGGRPERRDGGRHPERGGGRHLGHLTTAGRPIYDRGGPAYTDVARNDRASKEGGAALGRSVQVDSDPPRIASVMTWLRARPRFSLALAILALLVIFGLDLVVPGYATAGAYLVLVIFAAVALSQRTAVVIAAVGLALTLGVMAVQDRMNTENLLLVWFGVLVGAGLFALVSLYNSVETLFRRQAVHLARRSFLVDLVDAMLPLDDPREVEETATRLLGEQLGAGRVTVYEADETGRLVARQAFARQPTLPGPVDIQAFAAELEVARDGRALSLPAPGSALTQDQRTALDEAGLSSCLASTLHEDGKLAGAIVVCDTPPREWTDDESELLAESAARAWTEVRRARSDRALRETESRLRDTLDSTVDGLYRLNVRTGLFDYMSPSLAAMTGATLDQLSELDGPLAFSRIHPDDQAAATASLATLEKEGVAEVECRWSLNGEYRWYSGVIRLTSDEDGDPLFQTGTFRDVTEHKRREQNVVLVSELQDELAHVTSSADVMHATGTRLGSHLGVTYVYVTEIDPEREDGMVSVIWNDGRNRRCRAGATWRRT